MEEQPFERTLTVVNFGEELGKSIRTRVTLAPAHVTMVVASEKSVKKIDGLEVHRVNALLTNGDNVELFLTLLDLMSIERAVGSHYIIET